MKRNLGQFTKQKYDLLIIGAGIYGACIAWDATLRGLSVALLDKGDFGQATSANSLKTVHGGLRYMQQADLKRMRESIRERRTLMHIAPHLVHPLRCLMPTYGHATKGRELMAIALLLNDLIGFDRNHNIDSPRHLPRGYTISRHECMRLLPGIKSKNLSGGAVWHDCQMYDSERLTLAFIMSAAYRGATIANYLKAIGFLYDKNTITGIKARDQLTGAILEIQAKTVVNAAGPWIDRVLSKTKEGLQLGVRLAKAVNISTPVLFREYAVGLYGKSRHQEVNNIFNKGSRLFFVSPWRDQSLIGTTYKIYNGHPDNLKVTKDDVQELLDEINYGYPSANLTPNEVRFIYSGLVPVTGVEKETGSVQREKKYHIVDHRRHGLNGLITVLGVKYTTARDVAEKIVNQVFVMQGRKPPEATSAKVQLFGGDIENFNAYMGDELSKKEFGLADIQLRNLIYSYGTAYRKVLQFFNPQSLGGKHSFVEKELLQAKTRYAVKHEMAQKLNDVILRRTDIGSLGRPDPQLLQLSAKVMAQELGWSEAKINLECDEVDRLFALIPRPIVERKETMTDAH